jgi:hypothetical protein
VKKLLSLCVLISSLQLSAQESLSYTQLLEKATEITLTDSLQVSNLNTGINPIDTATVKKWFSPVLFASQTMKLKNRDFYLAGKITSKENFDLLMLVENKKRTDSNGIRIIHLVTTKKDGSYISSFKAAISGTKKKSSYNTSSWLYKEFNIVQDSKITTSTASLADINKYKISNSGRFIMYSN